MPFFIKKTRKPIDSDTITIVSGLPRSGTSMMMKMIAVGGLKPLTDNIRIADDDNPKGYYEFERVKKLENDKAWLPDAKGKVVKIISMLLKHLPLDYSYKVIFILRNMDEILASQKQMLIRRKEPTDKVSDNDLAKMYRNNLQTIKTWLDREPNFEVLYVKYNEVLNNPVDSCKKVNEFLGNTLDVAKMASIIDKNLYHQRTNNQEKTI